MGFLAILLATCTLPAACGKPLAPTSTGIGPSSDTTAAILGTVAVGILAKPTPAPMGSPSVSGEWKVVVRSAPRSGAVLGAQAPPGRELVVVTSELTNGGKASLGVSSKHFVLADQGGTIYKPVPIQDPAYLYDKAITIQAGMAKRIMIAYSIPSGVGPFTWTFSPPNRAGDAQPPAVLTVK